MSTPERFSKPSAPVSRYCVLHPTTPSSRGNYIHHRRRYNLPRARYDDFSGNDAMRTYSEWEADVINSMVLDDDHYYFVEDEADHKSDTYETEDTVGEMEIEEDEMNMRIEFIQNWIERICISTRNPRAAVLPGSRSSRPESLSQRLSASRITDSTSPDTIMEEDAPIDTNTEMDEDTPVDTDTEMDSAYVANTMMDVVAEKDAIKDTNMTMQPLPGLLPVQAVLSSALRTYHAMAQSMRRTLEESGHLFNVHDSSPGIFGPAILYSGPTSTHSSPLSVSSGVKRSRDIFEEG